MGGGRLSQIWTTTLHSWIKAWLQKCIKCQIWWTIIHLQHPWEAQLNRWFMGIFFKRQFFCKFWKYFCGPEQHQHVALCWDLVCWLYWQIPDQPTCKGRTGGSPFLGWSPSYHNLFYCIWVWLQKIITGQEFGSQISLVKEVIEVDELNEGNVSAATGK